MLALGFPAAAFATNCFVLAADGGRDGGECIVVDPGIGVEEPLADLLRDHRLKPVAVVLTHGHLDHVYSVTPVCGGDLAAYIQADDRYRLRDPLSQLDPGMIHMLEREFGQRARWQEPSSVVELTDGEQLCLAGLDLTVLHAPGHTEGSAMFVLPDVPDGVADGITSTVISGDVLFAGSIGRCDLPGGDEAAMTRSLREVVLPMPDDRLVLPGHGPVTTIGRERRSNPFLQGLQG